MINQVNAVLKRIATGMTTTRDVAVIKGALRTESGRRECTDLLRRIERGETTQKDAAVIQRRLSMMNHARQVD
jgi:polyhydroxyalkanoate synthesis regulator phasin